MDKNSFRLKYGKGSVQFELPKSTVPRVLDGNHQGALSDIGMAYVHSLDHPVDSAPLKEVVKPKDKVAITVSDITRGWQRNADTLPFLLNYLNAAGVEDESITIIIAVGAHRKNTSQEFREICGEEVCQRVRVMNHDAHDEKNHIYLGRTSRGTPVEVNRIAIEADKLILTGGVIYHYMVGYGGGRKSIMPGICSNKTIQACHLWSMEPIVGAGRSKLAQSKITSGNPSHEDMMECASLAKPDFIVNVVPNLEGDLCGIFAGNWISAWNRATRQVDQMYGAEISMKSDIVIATAGGYPKDINLYQTLKTVDNAVHAAKDGGISIILSECSDIQEPIEYFRWFDYATFEEHDKALRENYTIAGWCALITREYCKQSPTIMVTRSNNNEFARKAGLIPAATIQEALELSFKMCGKKNPSITIMPNGANTLPLMC